MKSGTCNRDKISLSLVTYSKQSPIKVTGMSTLDHHSKLLSRSNKLCSLQLHSLNFTLQSPYRTFCQRLQPRQRSLQLQHHNFRCHSSSSLHRRGRLHVTAASVPGSRPFQKMTSQTSRNVNNSQSFRHQAPKITTHLLVPQPDLELQHPENLTVKTFHQLLDVWPSHWMQIFQQGETRYRLTREEKEQLKSLGLQNFFNTSWPKLDRPHNALGRWKKS